MFSRFDVVVVGAGPAGAIAAWTLARAGARVAIVDGSHPREKPCGGGVTGRALALARRALDCADVPMIAIESARFEDSAGGSASVPLAGANGTNPMIVASRSALDRALLGAACHAGAHLVADRASDVQVGSAGVSIVTRRATIHADRVIGADGANSLVRRRVAGAFRRNQLSIGTGFYARGGQSREIVIRLVPDPPGYIWSFPRPDHLAIGICAQADEAESGRLRQICAGWIRSSGIAAGARLDAYSWPIPSLRARDFDHERPAADRWLLAGDAAGLVDPITREGIYFALLSGLWAAELLRADDRRATACYAARVQDEIYPELRRAASLKAGFFRPRFMHLLIEALAASEGVRRVMADLVAGTQPYRGLRRRLLATFEIGLAAKYVAQVIRGQSPSR